MNITEEVKVLVGVSKYPKLYSDFVYSRTKDMESGTLDLVHAVVGVSGEAGELLDAIKKVWVYNKPIDRANIVEELGDLRFYMQALMNFLGITEEEVIQGNVNKLQARYPLGYDDSAAIARADKAGEAVMNDKDYPLGESK